jgi:Ca2+-binding EF-hand superfamily protein
LSKNKKAPDLRRMIFVLQKFYDNLGAILQSKSHWGCTMMSTSRVVLAVLAVAGAAFAADMPSDGPMQGFDRGTERGAMRLERDFDRNGDGRVSRAEMNNVIGYRFATATHRGPTMSLEQFLAERAAEFRKSNEAMFHRLDWNGDGKLTVAEYGAAQRVRFVQLDRDGAGFVSCGAGDRLSGAGRGGLNAFCRDNDTNMDGRVTRAELDAAIARRFSQGAAGAQTMVVAQFVAGEEQRYGIANVRLFRRLDIDEDGLLTIKEFATSDEELFDTLDKNHDNVLTPAELHGRNARSKQHRGGQS